MEKVTKFILMPIMGLVILGGCDCFTSPVERNQKKEVKIEKAIAKRDFEKAREIALTLEIGASRYAVKRVNKAQISYMVSNGDIKDAEALSRELDCMDIFWEEVYDLNESDFR